MLSADGFALGKDERWRSMRSNHIVGELGRSQSQFSISCLRKPHSQAGSAYQKPKFNNEITWHIVIVALQTSGNFNYETQLFTFYLMLKPL